MAILSTDLKIYLSGGASNADPAAALGGAISSSQMGTNIFDNVTSGEASAGDTEYRGVYIKNTNGSQTLTNAVVWIQSNTPSTDTAVQIALCDEGASATMETIGNESTAPTGPTFDDAEDESNALSLGSLAAGAYYGIWIKRVVGSSAAAYANDGFTLRVKGDTE
jgi:hypothetical protein